MSGKEDGHFLDTKTLLIDREMSMNSVFYASSTKVPCCHFRLERFITHISHSMENKSKKCGFFCSIMVIFRSLGNWHSYSVLLATSLYLIVVLFASTNGFHLSWGQIKTKSPLVCLEWFIQLSANVQACVSVGVSY